MKNYNRRQSMLHRYCGKNFYLALFLMLAGILSASQAFAVDSDGDGVPDSFDACPGYDDRLDTDGDGTPDMCDGASWVQHYKIVQMTENTGIDKEQQVSANGQVTWSGYDRNSYQGIIIQSIENNGENMVEPTGPTIVPARPLIDHNGTAIIYNRTEPAGYSLQIHKVPGPPGATGGIDSTNFSISSTAYSIGSSGEYVAYEHATTSSTNDIRVYDVAADYTIRTITTSNVPVSRRPVMGSNMLVWEGDWQLFTNKLSDNATVVDRLTASYPSSAGINFEQYPTINASDHVAFQANEFAATWQEIYFYNGTNVVRVSNNSTYDHHPQINNNDQIAWTGGMADYNDTNNQEIYLYNGVNVTRLTNNAYPDEYPVIADNNYVVWQGFDGNDYEIYLYDGTTTTQLTNNNYNDTSPKIASNGTSDGFIVWTANIGGSDSEIMAAIPDIDKDEVPDTIDTCLTVNNRTAADTDNDGTPDACDQCPKDPHKIAPGQYGCGVSSAAVATGTNVTATTPEVPALEMTFAQVDSAGDVIINVLANPVAPASFILTSGTAYDIDFNGAFTGTVNLCIEYDEIDVADENALKLFHYANNTWIDITTSVE